MVRRKERKKERKKEKFCNQLKDWLEENKEEGKERKNIFNTFSEWIVKKTKNEWMVKKGVKVIILCIEWTVKIKEECNPCTGNHWIDIKERKKGRRNEGKIYHQTNEQ